MGCGSSNTSVQTFRNPEENKNYANRKASSRHSSAAPSVRSQRSADKKDKSKRKSSASSVSSASSSRHQTQTGENSRVNSASTKKTYTIQRPNSDVTHDNTTLPVAPHDENENIETIAETPVQTIENEINDTKIDEEKLEAQRYHEAIQKQTFVTGDPEEEIRDENAKQTNTKPESHDEIAKRKEEKRSQYNYEKLEEDLIQEHGLVALKIPPEMDDGDKNVDYTIDDIIEHNDEVGGLDWFKFGKKIYSWKKMCPIIQERVDQYAQIKKDELGDWWSGETYQYPIYIARGHGVSRKELTNVLAVCRVGNCVDIPREEYLARMKQSAENILEDDTDSECFVAYRNQLGRWLADYPMNKVYNDPPSTQSDPNEAAFPLPPDIQSDPYVLREWIETWTVFDCVVPEEGAWQVKPLLKDDWGDTHELFAKQIQEHRDDGSMGPLDMTIDGDVAWIEIELDLFETDKTTETQDMIWKKRASRTNLNDPEWMKKRREELAMALKKRYELRQITYPVENYMSFAEILEQHWKEFQELCEKEFNRPQGNFKKTQDPTLDTNENHQIDEGEAVVENSGDADNRHVLNHEDGVHDQGTIDNVGDVGANDTPALETMDSGLELDSAEHGSVEKDIGQLNGGDSIQLTDRPGEDENGKSQ